MRVVCWNIERGYKPQKIVEFLQSLEADIYMLYELDRGVKRTGEVDMMEFIQKGLPQHHAKYVREFLEIESIWRRIIPWGGPGGGEIGNAIFSKYPLESYHEISLPFQPPLTYTGTTLIPELFQPRKGSRKAQVCSVVVQNKPVQLISTHLELWRSDWQHRQKQLIAALGSHEAPTIFGGDCNSVGGALRNTLLRQHAPSEVRQLRSFLKSKKLTDPFPDTSVTNGRLGIWAKLDWLANSAGLEVKHCERKETPLSDHACLVVDYSLTSSTYRIGAE